MTRSSEVEKLLVLYDPIKDKLGAFFTGAPLLQRLFYRLLDLLFLRSWYVRRELHEVFRTLEGQPDVRVLDAGTGFGQYTYFMLRSFPSAQIVAVDIKRDYLEMARRFVATTRHADRVSFAVDDLVRLEAEGPFDVVLSVDVMEHIEEDEQVFRNFARVLRPGGFVIINTPSDQGGSGVEDEGDESFIGEHVRDGYNLEGLTEKLLRSGLTPEKRLYTYGRFGSAAWTISIKWPMQMLSRTWLAILLLAPYYLLALPIAIVLNLLDMNSANASGTGLLVVARRNVEDAAESSTAIHLFD